MRLARDGKSCAAIVLGGAARAEKALARELARCLGRASGAVFRVLAAPVAGPRILLRVRPELRAKRQSQATGRRDVIAWRCDGREELEIAGNSLEALELSVFAFLRDVIGCRWFFPGPLGEDIPRLPTLNCGRLDVVKSPSFLVRDFRNWPESFQRRALASREQFCRPHSFGQIVTPELAKAEPDLCALAGGRRLTEGGQPCLTHPRVEELAVRFCLEYAAAHPGDTMIPLAQSDCDTFCNCPACVEACLGRPRREGEKPGAPDSVSRGVMEFVNRVAARVADELPGKLLVTIAYGRTKAPPEGLRLRDNVLVWYCNQCNADNWQGRAGRELMQSEVRGWAAAARHVGIYEYVVNQSWPGLPRPLTRKLDAWIKFFHRAGARYYYTQHTTDFAINLPNYSLAAALAWDARRKRGAILDDMYHRCFGKAGDDVREYFDTLEAAVDKELAKEPGPGTFGVTCHRKGHEQLCVMYPPDVIAAAGAALARAGRRALEAKARRRLRLVTEGFGLLEMACRAARMTYDFETRYRIPTLAPWTWNVGNYDYNSAVEKLGLFGERIIAEFHALMDIWRDYEARRERRLKAGVVSNRFAYGGSFYCRKTLENIWKLYTGEIDHVDDLVPLKQRVRVV